MMDSVAQGDYDKYQQVKIGTLAAASGDLSSKLSAYSKVIDGTGSS